LPSSTRESLGFLLVDLARLYRRRFERAVGDARLEVTAGEARTLLHVDVAGPIRQAALAERMLIEPMSLSNFLDRLQDRGLVAREPDPADGRAKLVRLTPAAASVVKELRALAAVVRTRATLGLPAAEVDALHRSLALIRANLSETDPADAQSERRR